MQQKAVVRGKFIALNSYWKYILEYKKKNKITTKTSSSGNQRKKTNVSLKQAEEIKILK